MLKAFVIWYEIVCTKAVINVSSNQGLINE